ncbi:YGGT family [Musa troglodytarum]|uniref:YGGT family n=1 Tax=Musa troglodytarum TaxID=320322 RepID=A0A9E7GM09_9LILI|nr:YGGT family [Musa troglodytarum]
MKSTFFTSCSPVLTCSFIRLPTGVDYQILTLPQQNLPSQSQALCSRHFGFLFIRRILMSWYPKLPVKQFPYAVAYAPTGPFLSITRKVIPPLAGVDVTPVVWFGLVSFLSKIFVGPQGLLVLLLDSSTLLICVWFSFLNISFFSLITNCLIVVSHELINQSFCYAVASEKSLF